MRQAFLAETMETGTKNLCVIEATHVLKKALERLNFEPFRNVSVHEFYRLKALVTFEQVNTTEWSEKKRILSKLRWSGVVHFHCMQIASCDEHAVHFRR